MTDGDGVEDAWTPMFYIDGELMDNRNEETQTLKDMDVFLDELRAKIDAKLEAMGEKSNLEYSEDLKIQKPRI